MNIHEAILAIMRDVGAVGKDGYNSMQKFSYRGYDDVINAVSPLLRKHGVTIHQKPGGVNIQREAFTNGKGNRVIDAWGTITFVWTGPQGDTREVEVYADSRDLADKAGAKLETVLNRINLLMTLGLPTEDKDPDSEYPEVQSAAPRASQAPAKADPDTLNVLRSAIRTDAQAAGLSDARMLELVGQAGVNGRVSTCTDQGALQRLSDLIRQQG